MNICLYNFAVLILLVLLWLPLYFSAASFALGDQFTWWRHQMETFSALLAICAGNSPVTGEFPAQRPVTRGFDILIDLRLNKQLSKQSLDWWFETQSCPLWRHCNVSQAILKETDNTDWYQITTKHSNARIICTFVEYTLHVFRIWCDDNLNYTMVL